MNTDLQPFIELLMVAFVVVAAFGLVGFVLQQFFLGLASVPALRKAVLAAYEPCTRYVSKKLFRWRMSNGR
jgi:hypothetical protein